jgi:hypothetical protein
MLKDFGTKLSNKSIKSQRIREWMYDTPVFLNYARFPWIQGKISTKLEMKY